MAVTYEQLQKATLEDVLKNPQLMSAMTMAYGQGQSIGGLGSYWQSGYRNFEADKAYALRNIQQTAGLIEGTGGALKYAEQYGNWNNPNDPKAQAAAAEAWNQAQSKLKIGSQRLSEWGIATDNIPGLSDLMSRLGSAPGQGLTAYDTAQEQKDYEAKLANNTFQTSAPRVQPARQQPTPVAQTAAYQIKSGDTLSKIAAQNNTTIQALMAANPSITDPNKIYAGQSLNIPGVALPNSDLRQQVEATNGSLVANNAFINGAVKAYLGRDATAQELSKFAGQTVDQVRSALTSGAPQGQLVPSGSNILSANELETAKSGISDALVLANPTTINGIQGIIAAVTAADQTNDAYINQINNDFKLVAQSISDMFQVDAQKAQALEAKRKELGIDEDLRALQDVKRQIASARAEYTSQIQQVQNLNIAQGIMSGEQQKMESTFAAKLSGLQAQQEMIMGNMEIAEQFAQRAIDAEFAPLVASVEAAKALMPYLEKSQQQKLDYMLRSKEQSIAEQKQNRAANYDLMMTMVSNGYGSQISKVDVTKSPEENLKAVKNYIQPKKASGGGGGGGEVNSDINDLANAVIENPILFDQLTSTQKGQVIPILFRQGYTEFGKPLSDTAIKDISQTQKALEDLKGLTSLVQTNQDKLGPITGLAALNPWSESRKIQSDIDRVRQTVGKALEGGVLRKEDEEKYKKILATLTDEPDTALYKLGQLKQSIEKDLSNYVRLQKLGGKNVGGVIGETTKSPDDILSTYNIK